MNNQIIGSLIFAAGKGTRMKGYEGNKTLLPLVPEESPFKGREPILLHILKNLPPGPKALVVHHRKEEIIEATKGMGLLYYEQKETNGTGGALLAGKEFLSKGEFESLIITMGDVPFVRRQTYLKLTEGLDEFSMMVLGFRTRNKKKYGLLKTENDLVIDILEWEYWKELSVNQRSSLEICNGGIYAVRRRDLIPYLSAIEKLPHRVLKERGGKSILIEEFFITDLVKLMTTDGLKVGYIVSDEMELMGIDDVQSLINAQRYYKMMLDSRDEGN
jgi:bifunctional UDP-N-acetylglucosamine pyrophosphorylase/glucosamine-1-phosphate N-acetyltransferase